MKTRASHHKKSSEKPMDLKQWIPTTRHVMALRGWDELDVLFITGDAYIDHPSFGVPLLARSLEASGFRVGIIAQPAWRTLDDVQRLGRPRLFCGISAGSMDSMINKYTSNKRPRDYDAYTPGGQADQRPERATLVYSNLIRKAFPGLPVVIGGIEASLRRFTHYDYWDNKIRRSVLLDSRADILVHGMGEKTVLAIAEFFRKGGKLEFFPRMPGTARVFKTLDGFDAQQTLIMNSYEDIIVDKEKFNRNAVTIERESNPHNAKTLVEGVQGRFVVAEPPAHALSTEELDAIYDLPFTKLPHPS